MTRILCDLKHCINWFDSPAGIGYNFASGKFDPSGNAPPDPPCLWRGNGPPLVPNLGLVVSVLHKYVEGRLSGNKRLTILVKHQTKHIKHVQHH